MTSPFHLMSLLSPNHSLHSSLLTSFHYSAPAKPSHSLLPPHLRTCAYCPRTFFPLLFFLIIFFSFLRSHFSVGSLPRYFSSIASLCSHRIQYSPIVELNIFDVVTCLICWSSSLHCNSSVSSPFCPECPV